MEGPPICIGSCHPLFFVHVVVIAHMHMHMHTCTHVHTHWVIHTPTVAYMDRPFWVGCPYQQPATGTGNQNAYNCVYFDDIISLIYAVLRDYSSQWWSLVWTTNSKRSTWACIHLPAHHWCKTCTLRCYVCYPLYSMTAFLMHFIETICMPCVTTAMLQRSLIINLIIN